MAVTPARQAWLVSPRQKPRSRPSARAVLAAQIPAALLQWKVKPGDAAIRANLVLAVLDARDTLPSPAGTGVQQAMARARTPRPSCSAGASCVGKASSPAPRLDTLEQRARPPQAGVRGRQGRRHPGRRGPGHAQLTALTTASCAAPTGTGEVAAPSRPHATVTAGDARG